MASDTNSWIRLQAKFLEGMGFGSSQPIVIAAIHARRLNPESFRNVASAVQAIFERSTAELRNPDFLADCDGCLIRLIKACYLQGHNGARWPLHPWFRVLASSSEDAASWNHCNLILPYWTRGLGQSLLSWCVRTLESLLVHPDQHEQWIERQVTELDGLRRKHLPEACDGVNAFHLLKLAAQRNIAMTRYLDACYMLGVGSRARLFKSTLTCATTSLGALASSSKISTAKILARQAIPVPEAVPVSTEEEALAALAKIGFPVVVKPDDRNGGDGVNAGIRTQELFRLSFAEARALSGKVLIQRFVRGVDYRITVLDDQVIKVIRRQPGGVIGDGRSSVAELVAKLQATKRHQDEYRTYGRFTLALDREALGLLAESGLTVESVPEQGELIPLRRKANVSTGGDQEALDPHELHPDNLLLACRAAAALRLNIAGVDLLLEDGKKSWIDTGGVVLEVNAMPQIGSEGGHDPYLKILERILPEEGNIDVHLLITDLDASESQVQPLIRQLARELDCNGFSSQAMVSLGDSILSRRHPNGYAAARLLLNETSLDRGLCCLSARDVISHGLPTTRFRSLRLLANPRPQGRARFSETLRKAVAYAELNCASKPLVLTWKGQSDPHPA